VDKEIIKKEFTPLVLCKLEGFRDELVRWNKKFSLTKVHDDLIFEKLIAPSAWLGARYAKENVGLVADFGCGPGIPGMPMSIADVNNRYLLVDSNGKKMGFVRHCVKVLKIVDGSRVEARVARITRETRLEQPVDRLVTRAAGDMKIVLKLWQGKAKPGAVADFFKGIDAGREIEDLKEAMPHAETEYLDTPDWFGELKIVRVRGAF